ncbi:MAG: SufS family cysteine desulfurase [Planctomycetota bacterium]|jgi:cysteine desulfurase/selenocysteine lyase
MRSVCGDFPILKRQINGKPLVYLDNAATTQKPQVVLDTLRRYYETENANVHRGVHLLSQEATRDYEGARVKVQRFVNAPKKEELIFVRGATEAINLVAQTFGRAKIGAGDEIVTSEMEHHSNIVPWQILCEEKGAVLRVAPVNDDGELIVGEYKKLLSKKTKLVAINHVSNALGTINPIRDLIGMAHAKGVPVLVDGAQAVPHMKVDVQELDCDFYAFSSHKMYGPTGIGVLYGKMELLEEMPPWQGGGDMIRSVTFEKTKYAELPHKFEAGTPNIADTIAFGAAVEYLEELGMENVARYEHGLLVKATETLSRVPGLRLIGTAKEKSAVLSFVMEGIHPHDVGTIVDSEGVAIRTGHHCAQPIMKRFGVAATCRASMGIYNTKEEIDVLARALGRVREVFSR